MLLIHKITLKLQSLAADKKFSEILTGSMWALAARVLAAGLGLVTSVIIARLYGASVLGIVSVLNSLLMLVTIFTVMGTNTSILRLIPEHFIKYSPTSAYKLYRKSLLLVTGLSVIVGLMLFFGSGVLAEKIFSKAYLSYYFALAAMFIVFKSLILLNTGALRGLRLIKWFALMQVLPALTNLIPLVVLTIYFFSNDNPIYAQLTSIAVTGITGWVLVEYAFKLKKRPTDPVQPISLGKLLAISFPMLMSSTMNFIIGQTGVIMLGMFRSETEVGYYAVAVKLGTITAFVLRAVNTMAAPKFSELFHSGNIEELFYVAKKSTKLIFWTTAPIFLGLVLLGKLFLGYIYGWEFTAAYPALVFLIFSQILSSISGATSTFMNMTGSERVLKNIIFMITAVNICLNLWLIPLIGIVGAAISAMVSLSIKNVGILIYIKWKYGTTIGYFPLMGALNKAIFQNK